MTASSVSPVRSVAVCVATYQRPDGLTRLLDSFARLDDPDGASVSIVVCDNDPDGSAATTIAAHPIASSIDAIAEPRRGLSNVRNALVARARELGVDAVAFVDDDEEVPAEWVAELVACQHRELCEIVTGPVTPAFEPDVESWVVATGYFDPIDAAPGAEMTYANTNNVLIHLDALDVDPFDLRLNHTGGEDTHLFTRCLLRGLRMVWCPSARPTEYIPTSKTSAAWMRRREYRRGTTRSFVLRDLEDSWPRRGKRVVASVSEVGRGVVTMLRSGWAPGDRGRVARAVAGNHVAYAAGMIAGLFGASYAEYEVVHGS